MTGITDSSSGGSAAIEDLENCFAHIWMVRTFIRHCEEAEEDDDLLEVQRSLYDIMHSLGQFSDAQDIEGYLRQVRKKMRKLREAGANFSRVQPSISTHTNFRMAERSLRVAIERVERILLGS